MSMSNGTAGEPRKEAENEERTADNFDDSDKWRGKRRPKDADLHEASGSKGVWIKKLLDAFRQKHPSDHKPHSCQ